MKSPILGLLALLCVGVDDHAIAATLVGTTTDPTGLNGLVVDGTTYNVTFSTNSYQSPFTQGTAASLDAASAIALAMSSLGVTQLAGVSPVESCPPMSNDCQFNAGLFVAVDNGVGLNDAAACLGNPPAGPPSDCDRASWRTLLQDTSGNSFGQLAGLRSLEGFGYRYAADFTAVSEPATFGLLALGLAGFGATRRVRRPTPMHAAYPS
jgi:hypothetical protein